MHQSVRVLTLLTVLAVSAAARPLVFEPAGEVAPGAYVAHGSGYSLTVGPLASALSLRGQPVLAMQVRGGSADARLRALAPTGAKVHYLTGNDPRRWRTDVPAYAKVRVESVYPGIDLVYYGNDGRLEYDWIVRPGADPRAIRMAFSGQRRARIDRSGALELEIGDRSVRHEPPVVYQETANGRTPVRGRYVKRGDEIGFVVGRYDRGRPLVIDPILVFSTYLGGSGAERTYPHAVAVDAAGATYITGQTVFQAAVPVPFPISSGAFQTAPPGMELSGERAFVTKFRPDGSGLEWSTYLTGTKHVAQSGEESGRAIAVAGDGQACVVGRTTSTDFPTANAYQSSFKGVNVSAFAARLNASGSGLVWGTYFAGLGNSAGPGTVTPADSGANAVGFDPQGNAYVTGFGGVPVTAGTFQGPAQQPSISARSAFVAKFNNEGQLVYCTQIGGRGDSEGLGLSVDEAQNVYVTGSSAPPPAGQAEFPTTAGSFRTTRVAGNTMAAFATKLDSGGSRLLYSNLLSGSHADFGVGVAQDRFNNAWFCGTTTSPDFPGVGVLQDRQEFTPWVLKIDPGGFQMLFGTNLTAAQFNNVAIAYDVKVGPDACPVVSGETDEMLFHRAGNNGTDLFARGANGDGFVAKFNRKGGGPRPLQTYTGISTGGQAHGVALDKSGTITLAGTAGGNLPQTTPGAFQTAKPGSSDAFVMRIARHLANRDVLGFGFTALLFRNDGSGQVFYWHAVDERIDQTAFVGTIDARFYDVQGFNDLDGNGTPDILWRDTASGGVFAWFYEDQTFQRSLPLFNLDLGWRILGTGDFDGDGFIDLMIRNLSSGDTWLYQCVNGVPRAAARLGVFSTSFDVTAIGDFDLDGVPDLLLANQSSGDHFFWLMNRPAGGTITVKSVRFFLNLPSNFTFQGTCDANNDGHADLLLRSKTDGSLYFYMMGLDSQRAPTVLRATFVGRPDPGYSIKNK